MLEVVLNGPLEQNIKQESNRVDVRDIRATSVGVLTFTSKFSLSAALFVRGFFSVTVSQSSVE